MVLKFNLAQYPREGFTFILNPTIQTPMTKTGNKASSYVDLYSARYLINFKAWHKLALGSTYRIIGWSAP